MLHRMPKIALILGALIASVAATTTADVAASRAASAAAAATSAPHVVDGRSQHSRVRAGEMSAQVSSNLVALDDNPFVHGVRCDLAAGFVAVLALAVVEGADACDSPRAPQHCAFMRNPATWQAPDVLHGFREFPCKWFSDDDDASAAPYFAAVAARVSSRVVFTREDGAPLLREHVFAVTEVAALHVLQSVKGAYSATRTMGDPHPHPHTSQNLNASQAEGEGQGQGESDDTPPEWVPDTASDVPALRKSFAVSPAAAAAIAALRAVAEGKGEMPQPAQPFRWPIEDDIDIDIASSSSPSSGDKMPLRAESEATAAAASAPGHAPAGRRLVPSPSPRRGTYGGLDNNGAYYQTPKGKFSAKVSEPHSAWLMRL